MENIEDNSKEVRGKMARRSNIFGFYNDDEVVEPFLTKTVEKNMMKYIIGKVKYPK